MLHLLTGILLSFLFTQSVFADETVIIDLDIKPIESISKCIDDDDSPEKTYAERSVRSAQKHLKCGRYEKARKHLINALEAVDQLTTERGYCYSKVNCGNPKVSAQMVTKEECRSTLTGDSWQQVLPSVGACVNL